MILTLQAHLPALRSPDAYFARMHPLCHCSSAWQHQCRRKCMDKSRACPGWGQARILAPGVPVSRPPICAHRSTGGELLLQSAVHSPPRSGSSTLSRVCGGPSSRSAVRPATGSACGVPVQLSTRQLLAQALLRSTIPCAQETAPHNTPCCAAVRPKDVTQHCSDSVWQPFVGAQPCISD